MEMFNSTIMKIVVTQKKVNLPTSSSASSNYGGDSSPNRKYGNHRGIFGNSVLVNGVAMAAANAKDQVGIIRVGRGVGVMGKKY